jgi:SH3 domain protein
MLKLKPLYLSLIISLSIFIPIVNAEVRYVSDNLVINMRSEKGVGFRIVKALRSGAKLKIITIDKTGYTKVETDTGVSGWVLTRFLSKEPIARDLLKHAQDLAIKLKEDKQLIEKELIELKKEKHHLVSSEKGLLDKNSNITEELVKLRKIAARPMQLEKNNEKLRNELLSTESQTRLLKQELQTLNDDSEKQWFITGAAILFGGILLGLILPNLKSKSRQKQNWNRL